MSQFDFIVIGDKILIPIYSKGKRLLATEYAKVLDLPVKRSGEKLVLIQRPINSIKMVFTKDQLEKFWQEHSSCCTPVLKQTNSTVSLRPDSGKQSPTKTT